MSTFERDRLIWESQHKPLAKLIFLAINSCDYASAADVATLIGSSENEAIVLLSRLSNKHLVNFDGYSYTVNFENLALEGKK